MRIPVRIIVDGFRAWVSSLPAMALDVALFGVFRAHLRHALAQQCYRPVYLRSGRRNRVRL